MKSVLIFLTLLTFSLSVYFTVKRFERHGVSTLRIYDGTNDQNLSTKGSIIFNDEETAVASISSKGFLKYTNNDLELKVQAKEGNIVYNLSDDGKEYDVNDPAGKALLAKTIRAILETGFDARGRAQRLYEKGGAQPVLTAAANMKQEHIKSIYYDFLIKNDTLSSAELYEIINKTAGIKSDFEKARLLRSLSGHVKDSTLSTAFLHAVDGIDADFEKAAVLKEVLKSPLDSLQFHTLLKVCAGMEADYEKVNVLKKLITKEPLTQDHATATLRIIKTINADFEKNNLLNEFPTPLNDTLTAQAYLSVVHSMQSDFEKVRSLEKLLKQPINSGVFHEMALIAGELENDHEKSNLLKKMLDRGGAETQNISRILVVVHDMDGPFEKANLLKKIADKDQLTEEDWIGLLSEAGQVNNDFEKANVLIHIAGKMPQSDNIRTAYAKAAKTIHSESDYGRAMKATN